jgi:hypothetical protein
MKEAGMHRRLASLAAGGALAIALAGVASAAPPHQEWNQFTTDPYTIAECDGYDLIEQDVVNVHVASFVNSDGEETRFVNHSTSTGFIWRSDSLQVVATYQDAGGTFTAGPGNVFTWTGVHNDWRLADGTRIRDVGRVVVAEVAPGEFQRVFEAGRIPEPDPCTW